MFLFGMAWVFVIALLVGLVAFLFILRRDVNTIKANYENNSIDGLRKSVADLQAAVSKLTRA